MKCCKIKIFAFLCCLFCSVAFAQVEISDITMSDASAYGVKRALPFSCWGDMPFDLMIKMTQKVSHQRKSFELAKMAAVVLGQKTSLTCRNLDTKQAQKWNEIRLQALLDMGFYDDVIIFANNMPRTLISKNIARVMADAYLLKGQRSNACALAAVHAGSDDYFTKMNMMCLALQGHTEKAMLAFELWKENKTQQDSFIQAMNKLLDLPVGDKTCKISSVLDVFLCDQVKFEYDKEKLPMACVPYDQKQTGRFGNAVNIKVLLQRWKDVDESEKQYRLYLLSVYRDLFQTDLRFISPATLWNQPESQQKYNPLTILLTDKDESEITGADLLQSLWILSEQIMSADKALWLLNKGGLDIEKFVVERLN